MADRQDRVRHPGGGAAKVPAFPAPNVRWRDRLLRAATTQAMRLEYELSGVAARASSVGWPIDASGPTPPGTFVGLRIGWVAWFEDGAEHIGPDWALSATGRILDHGGHAVATEAVAAELVRMEACDHLATNEDRRHAYDEQVAAARRHVDACVAQLSGRLREQPPVPAMSASSSGVTDPAGSSALDDAGVGLDLSRAAEPPARRRPWGRKR